MYQWIAKRQIRKGFQEMSSGNFEAVLRIFAPDIHFTFAGNHALGANVRSLEGAREWFTRVGKLFPGLTIEAKRIFVAGLPWDMTITTEFRVSDTLPDGMLYENNGVQILRIRFGKAVEDHLIEDNVILSAILEHLAQLGHEEATKAPLSEKTYITSTKSVPAS